MSIWLWIIAAWGISYGVLDKKKVRFEHLIWLLLPVDMYGIAVAGVTVKPYMLFCLLLFCRMLLKRRLTITVKSRWSLLGGGIVLACIVVNMFNTQAVSSLVRAVMPLVVWGCSLIYLNDCESGVEEGISEAVLAAGVGYGLVFVLGYLLTILNLHVPGILAADRAQPGFFMRFGNMYQNKLIQAIRLRGFTIDPNTMIGTFLFCSLAALLRLARGQGGGKEVLGVILSGLCVILSNSRMGMLCFGAIVIGSVIVGYNMGNTRARNIIKGLLLASLAALILVCATDLIPDAIKTLLSLYANRSGLNDEYGRFTIWENAVAVLWERNVLFGIGMGQMQYFTAMGRACHNTWLEMLCAWGILAGGAGVIYFGAMIVNGFRYALRGKHAKTDAFAWTMVLGTLGVMISLITVDNVTYSYLWFGAAVVAALSAGSWKGKKT